MERMEEEVTEEIKHAIDIHLPQISLLIPELPKLDTPTMTDESQKSVEDTKLHASSLENDQVNDKEKESTVTTSTPEKSHETTEQKDISVTITTELPTTTSTEKV